ncbi:DUF4157 domain-containing protein [bacterium]|nr:DUF4157 domain-containing protein [bacterium]
MSTAARLPRSSGSTKSKTSSLASVNHTSRPAVLQRAQIAPETLTSTDVLSLQRTIGNRATVGLLSRSSGLQAKLKLGPAGDKHEQEADRVADQVVRQIDPSQPVQRMDEEEEMVQPERVSYDKSNLQRQAEPQPKIGLTKAGESSASQPKSPATQISRLQRAPQMKFTQERFVQRQDEEELAQMKPLHGAEGGEVESSVAQQIQSARGGGQPLNDGIRAKMERGFGANFSGVRVHTGGQADTLNRSLNARAFTVGNDVFFGKGQYNPSSSGGQKLLAHELTHTVQQGRNSIHTLQRKGKLKSLINKIRKKKSSFHLKHAVLDDFRRYTGFLHFDQVRNFDPNSEVYSKFIEWVTDMFRPVLGGRSPGTKTPGELFNSIRSGLAKLHPTLLAQNNRDTRRIQKAKGLNFVIPEQFDDEDDHEEAENTRRALERNLERFGQFEEWLARRGEPEDSVN